MKKRFSAGKTIWIARHGNRADFVDPNWRATAERPHDPPLSSDGVLQAQALGKRLAQHGAPIHHLFASPFLRTVQTAFHVAEAIDAQIKIEHGACEWLNPVWFDKPPGMLSPHEMAQRFPR